MKHDIMRVAQAIRDSAEVLYEEGKRGFCWNRELGGGCGDCSIVLWEMLGDDICHLISGTYHRPSETTLPFSGDSHCWVELVTGEIVDLTATQFGIDQRVFVVSSSEPAFLRYKKNKTYTGALNTNDCWGDVEWREKLRHRTELLLEGLP